MSKLFKAIIGFYLCICLAYQSDIQQPEKSNTLELVDKKKDCFLLATKKGELVTSDVTDLDRSAILCVEYEIKKDSGDKSKAKYFVEGKNFEIAEIYKNEKNFYLADEFKSVFEQLTSESDNIEIEDFKEELKKNKLSFSVRSIDENKYKDFETKSNSIGDKETFSLSSLSYSLIRFNVILTYKKDKASKSSKKSTESKIRSIENIHSELIMRSKKVRKKEPKEENINLEIKKINNSLNDSIADILFFYNNDHEDIISHQEDSKEKEEEENKILNMLKISLEENKSVESSSNEEEEDVRPISPTPLDEIKENKNNINNGDEKTDLVVENKEEDGTSEKSEYPENKEIKKGEPGEVNIPTDLKDSESEVVQSPTSPKLGKKEGDGGKLLSPKMETDEDDKTDVVSPIHETKETDEDDKNNVVSPTHETKEIAEEEPKKEESGNRKIGTAKSPDQRDGFGKIIPPFLKKKKKVTISGNGDETGEKKKKKVIISGNGDETGKKKKKKKKKKSTDGASNKIEGSLPTPTSGEKVGSETSKDKVVDDNILSDNDSKKKDKTIQNPGSKENERGPIPTEVNSSSTESKDPKKEVDVPEIPSHGDSLVEGGEEKKNTGAIGSSTKRVDSENIDGDDKDLKTPEKESRDITLDTITEEKPTDEVVETSVIKDKPNENTSSSLDEEISGTKKHLETEEHPTTTELFSDSLEKDLPLTETTETEDKKDFPELSTINESSFKESETDTKIGDIKKGVIGGSVIGDDKEGVKKELPPIFVDETLDSPKRPLEETTDSDGETRMKKEDTSVIIPRDDKTKGVTVEESGDILVPAIVIDNDDGDLTENESVVESKKKEKETKAASGSEKEREDVPKHSQSMKPEGTGQNIDEIKTEDKKNDSDGSSSRTFTPIIDSEEKKKGKGVGGDKKEPEDATKHDKKPKSEDKKSSTDEIETEAKKNDRDGLPIEPITPITDSEDEEIDDLPIDDEDLIENILSEDEDDEKGDGKKKDDEEVISDNDKEKSDEDEKGKEDKKDEEDSGTKTKDKESKDNNKTVGVIIAILIIVAVLAISGLLAYLLFFKTKE